MGNAWKSKGTTIVLSLSSTDIKAVLIEDPDIVVGEAENNKLTASDGTGYSFSGQEGDNEFTGKCVITHDTISDLMTAVYGSGTSTGAGGTVWDLTGAGGTVNDITFTPPNTDDGEGMYVKAVNAKGLVAKPIMELGTGWQIEVKFTCDKFQFEYDSSA